MVKADAVWYISNRKGQQNTVQRVAFFLGKIMYKEFLFMFIGFILIMSSIFYLVNMVKEYQCYSTWKLSNFKTSYSFFTGCLIEAKPNVWIPSKNYREI